MSYLPDAYARRARIAPFVVVVMPLVVLAAATAFVHLQLAGGVTLITGAYLVLAEQFSGDAGRRIQDQLWASWGGSPRLHRFRYAGSSSVPATDRLHRQVSELVGWDLPTQAEESANPVAADNEYDRATREIRERIHNLPDQKRFPRLQKENANYGFRRNLLGLRRWGIAAAAAAAIGAVVIALATSGSNSHRAAGAAVPFIYAVGSLIVLLLLPDDWPRLPGDEYADRLSGAIQTLHQEKSGA
jgi:hypothetical protein